MRSIFHFRDLLARHMSKMPLPMHHAIRSPASLPRIVDTSHPLFSDVPLDRLGVMAIVFLAHGDIGDDNDRLALGAPYPIHIE